MSHHAHDAFPTISRSELVTATGGAGAGGIDIAGIAGQIGNLAGGEKGQQMGGQIGGLVQKLIGQFGGGGGAGGGGGEAQ
jgi:hypothetical protein